MFLLPWRGQFTSKLRQNTPKELFFFLSFNCLEHDRHRVTGRPTHFLDVLTERHRLDAHRQIQLARSFTSTAERCRLEQKNNHKKGLRVTSFFFCPPPGGRHSTRRKKTANIGRLKRDFAQTDAMTERCSVCETRICSVIGLWVDQSTGSDFNREGLWVL